LSTEFQGGVLAELTRNGLVESIHSGHLIMLNADGSIYKTKGNVDLPIFPRSSVKCMQASAMVRNGLKLEPRLLALVEASHSGAAMHQEWFETRTKVVGFSRGKSFWCCDASRSGVRNFEGRRSARK